MSNLTRLHFMLDTKLLDRLSYECTIKHTSISKLIGHIWKSCRSMIESWDFAIEDCKDDYFGESGFCMTENLRITIDPEFKRQLFIIQGHYSLRSKAEILRFIIREYFKMLEEYSYEGFEEFVTIFANTWKIIKMLENTFVKKIGGGHMDTDSPPYVTFTYNKNMALTKIKYLTP